MPGDRLRSKGCCSVWSGRSELGVGLFSGSAGADMSAGSACLPYSISWRGWQSRVAGEHRPAGEEREGVVRPGAVESCGSRRGTICRGVAGDWQGCQGCVSAGRASLVACPVPSCFAQGPGWKGVTHICDGLGKLGLLPLKPCACSCPWQCHSSSPASPPSPQHHCDPPASGEVSAPELWGQLLAERQGLWVSALKGEWDGWMDG